MATTKPRPEPHQRARLLLPRAEPVDPQRVVDKFAQRYPSAEPLELASGERGDLVGTLGPDRVLVRLHERSLKRKVLAEALVNTWYWPEAEEVVDRQGAWVEVTCGGAVDVPLDRALRLTQVTASVLAVTKGAAAYWDEGRVLQPRAAFLAACEQLERDDPPLELWVDLRPVQEADDRWSAYSVGLDAFGLLEVEVIAARAPIEEVMELIDGIARYLIANGMVIGDGDTVGLTPEQQVTTSYTEPVYARCALALRLELKS